MTKEERELFILQAEMTYMSLFALCTMINHKEEEREEYISPIRTCLSELITKLRIETNGTD